MDTLTRELVQPLSLDDTRKISTMLSAQINDKQKAFSNKKKKAPKKAQLRGSADVDVNRLEQENINLYEGEYDDFM